ncbi:MAG: DMT family transporter [Emergencia sp.]
MKESKAKGIGFVVASAAFFGIMPSFVVAANLGGANSISVTFYRYLFSLPFVYGYLKFRGIDLRISKHEFWKILLITVFGFGGTTILLFTSYTFIPSGMATTIHYVYPVLIIMANVIFLKERMNKTKLACALLCLVAMALFNQGSGSFNIAGIVLAFSSGVTYCFYSIYYEKSSLSQMNGLKFLLYANALTALLSLCMAMGTHSLSTSLTPVAWGCILFLAIGATFMGSFFYQRGVLEIGAQSAGILSTLEPIVSIIVGAIIYRERIGLMGIVGSALILTAAVVVARMKPDEENSADN